MPVCSYECTARHRLARQAYSISSAQTFGSANITGCDALLCCAVVQQAVMVSYNEVDGEVNAASKFMLTEIIRNQYGGSGPKSPFTGFVSSDFGAISNLDHVHAIATSDADAIAKYITAGGSVQGFDFDHDTWSKSIIASTADGSLSADALDTAVKRVVLVKARLGLLDQPYVVDVSAYHALITSKAHSDVALLAAHKSMCLLQNYPDKASSTSGEPVLPFDSAKVQTVAVIGPNAGQPHLN